MPEPTQIFSIEPVEAGTRLDVFLARKLERGRNDVRRLLKGGSVRLNKRTATEKDKGLLLYAGSVVTIESGAGGSSEVVPQNNLPLVVLNEGNGWLAADKPAGMAVHPLEPGETGTLLNAVAARYPQIQGVGDGNLRSGVVHRLDLDTSGVILFATQQHVWQHLRKAFEEHRAKKVYRAIVSGQLRRDGRELMPLIVARHKPARVEVAEADHPKARMCDLSWRVVEDLNTATLIEIELGTGFLHQIRVMMAALGHPIVGDRVYGNETPESEAPRQMLHASFVRAADAQATSPDPADFVAALRRLRGH